MPQTAFLVRVTDAPEAEAALENGADRLGLSSARGRLSAAEVAAICAVASGHVPVSGSPAVLANASHVAAAISTLADAGVSAIEVPGQEEMAGRCAAQRARTPALGAVVVCPVSMETLPMLGLFAESGFQAALLQATAAARLIDDPGIEALSHFVTAAQRRGLAAWIAGALEPPDVPRMLALAPDVLAFRTSLCRDGLRTNPLDPSRIAMMRALVPRADASLRTRRDPTNELGNTRDKVFVRDFIVEAGIGAYRFEHRKPQRMRFNVEADLAPIPHDVADMRDVFSYDVIIDAIRLATRRHVILVERIALDVAETTLRDPRVVRVRVRVEKLDILDGAVGVEIEREREN